MVRKKFIDKKSATTYSLVYRSTDGCDDDDGAAAEALDAAAARARVLAADGADRVLVAMPQAGEGAAGPSSSSRLHHPPTSDPRALYRHFFGGDDDDAANGGGGLSEAKRRELLSLGFPDDGYDYLKHMRVVGGQQQQQRQAAAAAAATAAAEASAAAENGSEEEEQVVEAVGPATFLRAPRLRAPAPDVKLVDARGVRTKVVAIDKEQGNQGESVAELERELRAMGLGGAARSQLPARGALAAELAEVEAALEAEEEEDDEAALLAAEKAAAEAAAAEEQEGGGGGGGERARNAAAAAAATATVEGRGDLEDDFLAFANAPADGEEEEEEEDEGAPLPQGHEVVVGFDAPSGGDDDDDDVDDNDGEDGARQRHRPPPQPPHHNRQGHRATDASPSEAAAYAELNSQFDRLMQEEYDDEDEEDEDEGDERRHHRHGRSGGNGGARTVGEELTPARLAALLSGGVGGEEAPYDESDDAYFDDEADGYGGRIDDPAAAERARERRERQRAARAQALAELEGCAPVIPNAARVATLDERDEEVLAATKARVAAAPRLRGDDEVDEKGRVLDGAGEVGQGDEPLETLHVRRVRDRWDCESVLSLRTTASFQPSRIGDGSGPGGRRPRSLAPASGAAGAGASGAAGGGVIRLSQRTGLPAGYGPRAHLEGGALEEVDEEEEEDEYEDDEDEDMDDGAPMLPPSSERRPRHETPEEKRARKGAAKAAQRAAREQKRQLKAAFREEAGKQRRQRAAVGAGSGASTFVIP